MRIAFFTDDYFPYVHGVTTSIQNTRQALEELGHEVWIVAPEPKQKDFVEADDHVIRMPSVNSYIFDKRPVSLLYPGIARKLYKYDFDVVHSHTQFYLFVIAGMVAKKRGIPHITTVHTLYTELLNDYPTAVTAGLIAVTIGFPFVFKTKPVLPFKSVAELRNFSNNERGEIMKQQGWRLTAASVNQATAAIAPSHHLAESLKQHGAHVPLYEMTNGISLERYRDASSSEYPLKRKKGEKIIISVARVSGEKRQKVLIESMSHLKTKNVRLVLAGDGPEVENLKQLASTLGVADRVEFTNMVSQAQVAALLKQADIFTLASYRFDNQPMTILEATASGLPIVYCDDQLTEGLTKANARLTSGIEGKDFAESFDALLADKELLQSMGKASLELSKKFDRKVIVRQLLKLYQSYDAEVS